MNATCSHSPPPTYDEAMELPSISSGVPFARITSVDTIRNANAPNYQILAQAPLNSKFK